MALGSTEILLILAALIILFGAPRVIDWAKALGQAKRAYHEEADKKTKK